MFGFGPFVSSTCFQMSRSSFLTCTISTLALKLARDQLSLKYPKPSTPSPNNQLANNLIQQGPFCQTCKNRLLPKSKTCFKHVIVSTVTTCMLSLACTVENMRCTNASCCSITLRDGTGGYRCTFIDKHLSEVC